MLKRKSSRSLKWVCHMSSLIFFGYNICVRDNFVELGMIKLLTCPKHVKKKKKKLNPDGTIII